MSGGGKSQTSKSKTVIPEWVKKQYLKATDMAAAAADNPWQAYSTNPNDFVAGLTESQQAGKANINQYAQSAQPWYQGAGQATVAGMGPANLGDLDTDKYMNPYLRNVAQTQSDLMNQQNQRAMSGQLGSAIQSGAAWGDRSGVALANLNQQQNLTNSKILNDLLYQGYGNAQAVATQQQGAQLSAEQQNLARLMSGGQQLGELGSNAQAAALQGGQAQMAAGQQEQQTEQAKKSAMYTQFLQEKGYDFQTAQFFANIAMGIGSNAGSTNVLTQPAGFFSGLARGGRAGKAAGGGLGAASMGGHVGAEHALEGFADGGMPQDYSAMVMQALFGGMNPSAGAYGMAGGMPGGMGFVPQPNMQVTGLKPAEAPPMREQTSAKDVANAAKASYDIYNSEEGQKALGYAKNFLGFMSPAPSQARGGRTGYAIGGSLYSEDPIMGSAPGLAPTPSFIPPPDQQNTGKGLKAPEAPSAPPSDGLGKMADIAKIAATIIPFLLKDGGVAGPRRGYDTGGAPAERSWSEWLDQTFPTNGPAAGTPPDVSTMVNGPSGPTIFPSAPNPRGLSQLYGPEINTNLFGGRRINPVLTEDQRAAMDALRAARATMDALRAAQLSAPAAAPTAAPLDNTEALNQAQEEAQKSVDQTWAESQDPHMGRVQSGLKMGQAALEKGLGVYLPGVVNWALGDPTRANSIGGEPGSAPAAAPADLGATPAAAAPAQASTTQASAAPADFRPPAGLNPAPAAPTTAAAAPPIPKQRPAGLVPDISPVEQMAGERQSGLQMFQANAYRHEGDAVNHRDPNGGTRAGFNLAQYQSINPSIRSLADVQQSDIRNMQGKWWREQGGSDIEAKYGSEFAAAYTDLSMLNPNMARSALAQANGDPAKFFDIMGGKLASLGENPKYAPNTNGWLKRVADTKNFALTGSPSSADTPTTLLASGSATALPAADNKIVPGLGGQQTSGVPQIRQAADELAGGIGRGVSGAGQWAKEHENILLPLLQGLGAMASSPSRYLGSAILQGVGAGAGSYMKREKQLADMAATRAQTLRENINSVRESLYYDQGTGQTYVILASGGYQPLADYMDKPAGPNAGGAAVDQAIRQMGVNGVTQLVAGNAGAPGSPATPGSPQPGMPVPPAPPPPVDTSQVFWSPAMDVALAADRRAATRSGSAAVIEQSNRQFTNIQNEEVAATRNAANVSELANVVNSAIADGNVGPMNEYLANFTGKAKTAARALGINPDLLGQADSQAIIMNKLAALNASQLTPEGQEAYSALKLFADLSPSIGQPPEAMAAIAAQLMATQQRALDLAPTVREYRSRSVNGVITGAEAVFNKATQQRYAAERDQLQQIFLNEDPEVHRLIKEISEGTVSEEDGARAFNALFGNPALVRYFAVGAQ